MVLQMNDAQKISSRLPPRLSVIVPNYNHGALIGRALAALAKQRRPPDEIIVVDDGSSDDSVAIIEQLSRGLPNLRVFRYTNNQGVIYALNHGISEARNEFIYLGAADDV